MSVVSFALAVVFIIKLSIGLGKKMLLPMPYCEFVLWLVHPSSLKGLHDRLVTQE